MITTGTACLVAACSASEVPATNVVVRIDGDDAVRELAELRVELYPTDAKDDTKASSSRVFKLGQGQQSLPFSFGVAPGEEDEFLVSVTGYRSASSRAVIEAKTIGAFQPGKTELVRVFLRAACLDHPCDSLNETCGDAGECVSVPVSAAEPIEPGGEIERTPPDESSAADAGTNAAPRGDASTQSDGAASSPNCKDACADPAPSCANGHLTGCAVSASGCKELLDVQCSTGACYDTAHCAERVSAEIRASEMSNYASLSVVIAADGCVWAVGRVDNWTTPGRAFLLKWNADGKLLWNRDLVMTDDTVKGYDLVTTPAGQVLIVGKRGDNRAVALLFGADATASSAPLWIRDIGPDTARTALSASVRADGKVLVAATTKPPSADTTQSLTLLLDPTAGDTIWSTQHDVTLPQAIAADGNNAYFIANRESGTAYEGSLFRLDANGAALWEHPIEPSGQAAVHSVAVGPQSQALVLYVDSSFHITSITPQEKVNYDADLAPDSIRLSPGAAGDLLVLRTDTTLSAIRIADGAPSTFSPMKFPAGGRFFARSTSPELTAIVGDTWTESDPDKDFVPVAWFLKPSNK